MYKLLLLIFIIPATVLGQSTGFPTETDLAKIYSQAVSDFIKDANKKNKLFDTLYIGKRKDEDPYNDFPDIELPEIIEHTHIILISPEIGAIKQKERKSGIYINMIGWINKEKAEFLFYVFSNGFEHQYNYKINYKYNIKKKEFELDKVQFKDALMK